jgi:hypothetical protein
MGNLAESVDIYWTDQTIDVCFELINDESPKWLCSSWVRILSGEYDRKNAFYDTL